VVGNVLAHQQLWGLVAAGLQAPPAAVAAAWAALTVRLVLAAATAALQVGGVQQGLVVVPA
jgi:hypothetical protein